MLTSQVKDFHKRPYYKDLWDGVCLMSPHPTKVAAFEGQYCSPRTPSGERSPNDWTCEGSQQLLGAPSCADAFTLGKRCLGCCKRRSGVSPCLRAARISSTRSGAFKSSHQGHYL